MNYLDFIKNKALIDRPSGFSATYSDLNKALIEFQKQAVIWALKRGRAALFEDCGLGKTFQQLEWARMVVEYTGKPVLILAPLSVSRQTKAEGRKFGIDVTICEIQSDINKKGINITNYEKLHKFNTSIFSGVVLDESSCLKSYTSKYRTLLIDTFKKIPYRLCCTATPSPNDFVELGNHAEFLGILSRSEMLSMFFINDSGDTGTWRLKKHAVKEFWKWVCSWAIMIQKPSDLGYDDGGFILPPIQFHEHIVQSGLKKEGFGLIPAEAKTIQQRRQAKRDSLPGRVKKAAEIVNKSNEQWIIWCQLNSESDALEKAIKNSVSVQGADSDDHKVNTALGFIQGDPQNIISKSSIYGFGMNWQHCHNVLFVGLSDSYEEYYQAIRRCWRFGQEFPVNVHVVSSEAEGAIVKNIKNKEQKAQQMISGMLAEMSPISSKLIRNAQNEREEYNPTIKMKVPAWLK